MHQKRARQPHEGSSLASTQARLGRLVVRSDHRALRDRVDLVHREEPRGQQEALEEEVVLVDSLRPRDQVQAQVEDLADRRRPHHRHSLVERTQIGERCSTTNSSA